MSEHLSEFLLSGAVIGILVMVVQFYVRRNEFEKRALFSATNETRVKLAELSAKIDILSIAVLNGSYKKQMRNKKDE